MEFCSLRTLSMNDDHTIPATSPIINDINIDANTLPSIDPILTLPNL